MENSENYELIERQIDRYLTQIGMRKGAGLYKEAEEARRNDAKHNLSHHSTRQRLAHREGRLESLD